MLQLPGACPKFVVLKDRSGAGRPGGISRQPPQPSFERRAAQGLDLIPELSPRPDLIKWTCWRMVLPASAWLTALAPNIRFATPVDRFERTSRRIEHWGREPINRS